MPDTTGPKTKKPRRPRSRPARAAAVSLIVTAVWASPASAVVLGDVRVQSALGQPLVAEVELLDADQDSLKAGLASPTVHRQHSFQPPSQLGNVNVRVVKKRNGQRVLRVTSDCRPVDSSR